MSNYINSILKTNFEIHNRSTRFANLKFHCPVLKKKTQLKEAGPLVCKPLEIGTKCLMDAKEVKNAKSFKKKLYTNLTAKQKETGLVILNIF